LTVLAADPLVVSPDELIDVPLKATIVDGRFRQRPLAFLSRGLCQRICDSV
jgi:hypothetical protein